MQQVLSVPSQFGDGHAKNFSMAWLPMGRYRLTPLYDVMSIWPLEGNGPSQFSRHEAKLAMALSGKSRHDHFKTIQRRHLNAMAQKCHYGPDAENIIQLCSRQRQAWSIGSLRACPRTFRPRCRAGSSKGSPAPRRR